MPRTMITFVSHACWLSSNSESTEVEALEEVDAERLEDTDAGTDSESSLIAPGRGFRPSFIGRQSFSVRMSVAASQPQKPEWELRGLLKPMEARADRSELIMDVGGKTDEFEGVKKKRAGISEECRR